MDRRGTTNMTPQGAYVKKMPNVPVTQRALMLDGSVQDVQIPFKRHRHDSAVGAYVVSVDDRCFVPITGIIEVGGEYLGAGALREIEAPA